MGKNLYNGIQLPEAWPPRDIDPESDAPMPVPYLENIPEVIPIDVGRQLFVDDFMIEETDLECKYHKAQKYVDNPVFKPETALEREDVLPVAAPKSGGIWWDPEDKIFKMWYEAGWLNTMAYAESEDGFAWNRPRLDIQPGTNRLLPELRPDSTTVFLDHNAPPAQKFKMFLRGPGGKAGPGNSMVSADGIHWSEPVKTGDCGDRSTMFYNPFRQKWVYSIRSGVEGRGRTRHYYECDDFLKGANWGKGGSHVSGGGPGYLGDEVVFWTGADRCDPPDPEIGQPAQLYNLDAVAYESLMLGLYEIHLGPPNSECGNNPKITELNLAYSRDGFHWHRPDREPFIAATRRPGSWDRGYVQSVGGLCLVVGDELWFYYIGFRGGEDMYANASTGLARIRRDGFASLEAGNKGGILTTRPVTFSGKHLFVNADCLEGKLQAELLDQDFNLIQPFIRENCIPVSVDSTCQKVTWKGVPCLPELEQPVRFRFYLENGRFFSFWVSPDETGASRGYLAGGGTGCKGDRDTAGV